MTTSGLWPWLSVQALTDAFLPTALQAEGLAAVFASGLIMVVIGRAILGERTLPEIALMAGWGVVSLVLTIWGVKTPDTMRIPAIVLIGFAAVSSLSPRGQLSRPDGAALGRIAALAIPLIAVLAAAMPSGPDTFTNQLPNAAYLFDYDKFPAKSRPPMLAVWPAFPYNLQLATFLPTLLTPGFPPNILGQINLMFELAFAVLLARQMGQAGAQPEHAPGWRAAAGALLLTTFLNPGFDPKIQFSGYGDPTIAVILAFVAWQAERLLSALAGDRAAAEERLALTLLLLAGAAIKQVSIYIMVSAVGTAMVLGLFDRRIGLRRTIAYLAPPLVPALLLVVIWRFYVAGHFQADDELRFLPLAEWNLARLPKIFGNMAIQIWQKLPFFVLLYGIVLAAAPLALRRGLTPASRLFLITAGVTLLYTAFLVFTYVAHFPGEIGASAHSFFRYNLHLQFLATLAFVAFARESWMRRGAPDLGGRWRAVGVAAIVLALVAPVAGAGLLRRDQRMPEPLVWRMARFAAPHFQQGDRVALLLPGDNRSVAFMLRVAIAIDHPHSGLANFKDVPKAYPETLDTVKAAGVGYALISCVPSGLASSPVGAALGLKSGETALLARDGQGWKLLARQDVPADLPPAAGWTHELSPGPFCR